MSLRPVLSILTDQPLSLPPHPVETLQVWVYGNSFKSSVVAVVVPSAGAKAWAQGLGVEGDLAAICASPKAKEAMLAVRGRGRLFLHCCGRLDWPGEGMVGDDDQSIYLCFENQLDGDQSSDGRSRSSLSRTGAGGDRQGREAQGL